jgi:methylmalonyl-CoA mutase
MEKNKKLFDKFPPVSTKEWLERLTSDLKGADFNEKLVWKSDMGFDVLPFYRAEDTESLPHAASDPGEAPWVRGKNKSGNEWRVRQNIEVTDYSAANTKALAILMRGVESLGFIIADPESVSEKNFSILLEGIHIEAIEINFISNGKAAEILGILKSLTEKRGLAKTDLKGAIEADPLGKYMINGKLCVPVGEGFDYLSALMRSAEDLPHFRVLQVNAAAFCNAGTDPATQLAYGLSMANEYLDQLTERGLSPDLVLSKTRFCFAVGSSYFAEIARLRAARMLWSLIAGAYEPAASGLLLMNIHCVTSAWNKTTFDPYVNMLRTQTEAMSAILGGTDSLTVGPFDEVFRKTDDFSERIARNQQLILREESYFDKVADPAAGSYYVENLTSLIAESAWKLFIATEEEGGFLQALRKGSVQAHISEIASRKTEDFSAGRIKLLGTNLYPNAKEDPPAGYDMARMYGSSPSGDGLEIIPVRLFRAAENIERERLESKKEGGEKQ